MRGETWEVSKGGKVLAAGSLEEVARKLGVKESTVRWWATPTNRAMDAGQGTRKVARRISDEGGRDGQDA